MAGDALRRAAGTAIALADGIHFPMSTSAGGLVYCRVRYDALLDQAGPGMALSDEEARAIFECRRDSIERAASRLYERGVTHVTVTAELLRSSAIGANGG